jgi:hypothetical protein
MNYGKDRKGGILIRKGGELFLSGSSLIELLWSILDKGVPFRLRAKGFSMSPFIRDGDVITVAPLPGTSLQLGDVLASIHPKTGKLIVHRVVRKWGNSCLINGDAVPETDGLVSRVNVLGRVSNVERDGKEVFLGLGPERFLIAFFSHTGLFPSLLLLFKLFYPVIRRSRIFSTFLPKRMNIKTLKI